MQAFRAPLHEMGEFEEVRSSLKKGEGLLHVSGCLDAQKAHLIDGLSEGCPVKVIVAADDLKAKELYDNYRLFDRNTFLFPAKDFIFYQADIRSNLVDRERMAVWKALAQGLPMTVVATIQAFMNRLMPFDAWKENIRTIKVGDEVDVQELKSFLVSCGYERNTQAEGPGQFSVRGNIVDIYPLADDNPVRIELWGDEVDSIRTFDAESQRSIEEMDSTWIYPASELVIAPEMMKSALSRIEAEAVRQEKVFRSRIMNEEAHRVKLIAKDCHDRLAEFEDPHGMDSYLDYFFKESRTMTDSFPEGTLFFLDEPNRLAESARAAEEEFSQSMQQRLEKGYALPGQTKLLFPFSRVCELLSEKKSVGLSMLDSAGADWKVKRSFGISVTSVSPYNNSFDLLVKDLKAWKRDRYRVILLCASHTRGERMAGDLRDEGLNAFYSEDETRELSPGELMVTYGNVHRGYMYPLLKFVVVSETDIFGREKKKRRKQRMYEGRHIASFADLSVGDYVVHESHGLGIYRGIEKIEVNHVMKDYMKLEYDGGSSLYVPVSQLDVIQKYADSDAKKPKLNRLGTQEWNRTKTRVRGAVRQIARELVDLYALRQSRQGFVYGPDTVWQKEFEEMFPFEETDDQLMAIAETKMDMESTKIMDRLICGDVGYGKTEIALRASFKAVQEGKQVAYLVPTTILAQQHYNTFVQRMKDFPVRVDLLCRFRSSQEQKKTVADLKRGLVDVVIGTHRLLSKDVVFKNLGLLIIDEEQRFGVTHKEKIKQLKKDVDVLTLTATPIPRTLHMSLIGIRDMSVLQEAPSDRLPIQTFVMEYNEELVREAISRELARNGQVYYVYNRVSSIMDITARISAMVPSARVAFAHGRMNERQLEGIMVDFINGEIDVLVTTTIIETGLDIPNANTMIIHDADNMGLSQLYQLRGRIGRSSRTSYAFLMYRRNKLLRETAEKRLSAIREFTELGSGFKIAMRDLEIRGAGNLLGSEQSGHMEAVGYDLYCKLLNESVREEKGEATQKEAFGTTLDIDLDAYIPDKYISNENQKLDIYKRIAAIDSQESYDDMLEELMDRFGEIPAPTMNLLRAASLRTQAHDRYLTEISQSGEEFVFTMYELAPVNVTAIDGFVRSFRGKMVFRAQQLQFIYRPFGNKAVQGTPGGSDILQAVRNVLEGMDVLF